MGFPIQKTAERAALIAVMLGGGLLYAGISQAQNIEGQDGGVQNARVTQERGAELVAAVGGPAPTTHLTAFARNTAAVDVREDDVADEPAPGNSPPVATTPVVQPKQVVIVDQGDLANSGPK